MRETTFLLLAAIAFLARKAYPEFGWWPWLLPLGYAGMHAYQWWTVTRPAHRREQAERHQLYLQVKEHSRRLDEIRDRYDPNREWNEGTPTPWAYQIEVRDLYEEYREVFKAWYGPDEDEDDDDDEGDRVPPKADRRPGA